MEFTKVETKVFDYIHRNTIRNKDKFRSGMKSDFYQWEEFESAFMEWVKCRHIRQEQNIKELIK